jgi:hypothetical protein
MLTSSLSFNLLCFKINNCGVAYPPEIRRRERVWKDWPRVRLSFHRRDVDETFGSNRAIGISGSLLPTTQGFRHGAAGHDILLDQRKRPGRMNCRLNEATHVLPDAFGFSED